MEAWTERLVPRTPREAAKLCTQTERGLIYCKLPSFVNARLGLVEHLVLNFYGVLTEFGEEDFLEAVLSEGLLEASSSDGCVRQDLSDPWCMRAIRSDVTIPSPEVEAFERTVARLRRKGLTKARIAKAIQGLGLPPREGTRGLLASFDGSLVVSPGIDLVIETFLTANDLRLPVVATRLTDEEGVVSGFDRGTVAAGYRCAEALRRFSGADSRTLGRSPLPDEVIPFSSMAVIGGLGVDAGLMQDSTANILFLAPGSHAPDALVRTLTQTWNRIHLIVIDTTFETLARLLEARR